MHPFSRQILIGGKSLHELPDLSPGGDQLRKMDPEPTPPISRVSVEEFERDMRKARARPCTGGDALRKDATT